MKKIFKLLLGISGLISVPFVISCNTKSQNLVLENFDDKLVKNALNTFVIASHENLVRKIDEYLKNPNNQARINEWKKRNAQELLLLNSIKDIDTFKKNNKTCRLGKIIRTLPSDFFTYLKGEYLWDI